MKAAPTRPSPCPYLSPPRAGPEILAALSPTTGDGLRPLFRPTPRQVALADYLAACVRRCEGEARRS